jgi:hypothetical protein
MAVSESRQHATNFSQISAWPVNPTNNECSQSITFCGNPLRLGQGFTDKPASP